MTRASIAHARLPSIATAVPPHVLRQDDVPALAGTPFGERFDVFVRLSPVSSTGIAMPSLEARGLAQLWLRSGVQRVPVFLAFVRQHEALEIGRIMLVTGAAQLATAPLAT